MTHALAAVPRREEIESTVLIASADVLASWSLSAASPNDLLTLADADIEHALAVIERRRPHIVVLEQMFMASSRGASLVGLLRGNPALAGLDIRILPAARSAALGVSGPVAGRVLASMAQPLPPTPVRRARRIAMPDGAELRVNGGRAALINVSTFGVQVVSPTILRPHQKVEIVIDRDGIGLHTRAEIAWSAMELAGAGLTCRAGVAFTESQPELGLFASSPDATLRAENV